MHAAKPPLPAANKGAARWETHIDPVNQDALIRARYPDRTTEELRVPRSEVATIARFLHDAAQRFAVSAEMRQ